MRHTNRQHRIEPYPLHEAVVDVLETYFGSWWTIDAIAHRLGADSGSVRKAIRRSGLPVTVISRESPDTGATEYQATCRAYLYEEPAA